MRYLPFIIISLVLYILFFYHNQQPDLLSSEQINIDEKIIPLNFEEVAQHDKHTSAPISELEQGDATQQITSQKKLSNEAVMVAVVTSTAPSATTVVTTKETKTALVAIKTPLVEPVTKVAKEQANKELLTRKNSEGVNLSNNKSSRNKNSLVASIKATSAEDVARLRGELYEQNFHLDLPPPPAKKKSPKKKKATNQTKKATTQTSTATVAAKNASTDSITSELLKQKNISVKQTDSDVLVEKQNEKPKRTFKKQVKPMQATSEGQNLQEAIAVSGNKPHYPEKARAAKQQGQVAVIFTVNMRGKTKNPKIMTSSGHQVLDDAVLDFIAKERFMPALEGIEKVTREQQFSFKYELK